MECKIIFEKVDEDTVNKFLSKSKRWSCRSRIESVKEVLKNVEKVESITLKFYPLNGEWDLDPSLWCSK